VTSRDEVVEDAYESELPRVLGMLAAIWQLTLLIQVLGYLHEYRNPVVPVVVWLGLVAAALWLIPRTRAGYLTGREAAIAIAIAVTAVSLFDLADRAQGAPGSVDWSIFGTSWLLALVAVSRPAWEWVSGAVVVFVAHFIFSGYVVFGPARVPVTVGLTRITASAYTLAALLIIFAAIRPTVRAQAAIAVRRTALASRSAAERTAMVAIREDRRERLALLEMEALPLLRGIADGTLDLAESSTRERCARHAARLRHSLVDRALSGPTGILTALEPALRAARARGLLVEVQVVGDPGETGPGVAAATLATVNDTITALPPHPVTLTLLAPADEVELYVTFSEPPRTTLDVNRVWPDIPAPARWRAAVTVDETGAGYLEVYWRKEVAR
jgi:hypothetical protein